MSGSAGLDTNSAIESADTDSAVVVMLSESDNPTDHDHNAAAVNAEAPARMNTAAVTDAPIDIPTQSDAAAIPTPTPLPVAKPIIKPVIYRSSEEICETLDREAKAYDLPVPFFIRLLFQESRFSAALVSSAGAQGIAQFMPETSADVGLDNPFDPLEAIPASARLLRGLMQKFGNLGLAAAAYNAGTRRIQEWLGKKGNLPQQTQNYVQIITGLTVDTWKGITTGLPAMRLPREAPCQEMAGLLAWDGPEQIPLPLSSPLRAVANEPAGVTVRPEPAGAKAKQEEARVVSPDKAGKRFEPAAHGKSADAHARTRALQLAARKRANMVLSQR
jgi:hypothetical protein